MSANPSRIDWPATEASDPNSPLQEGNRVLESIARQEALRSLLAFSSLHSQIRNRLMANGRASDPDLFQTERFILDEVLQLVCDRLHAITHADGIVVALVEGQQIVCRAAAGPVTIERNLRLIRESEFLREGLSGARILRCDDCEIDTRLDLDFARQVGSRSTVLVPLRGRSKPLGVLQAFSRTPWAFTDDDVRTFDLFAELVLSALKPEDQDRRIHWLSDVAAELLQPKSAAEAPTKNPGEAATPAPLAVAARPEHSELASLSQPLAISAPMFELPDAEPAEAPLSQQPLDIRETPLFAASSPSSSSSLSFLHRSSLAAGSHPGLSVVLVLMAVAALFSAGAWWGIQGHGKSGVAKTPGAALAAANTAASPSSATATLAPASENIAPATLSDNLLNPPNSGSDAAPLTAVGQDKLAALPKVVGVRHWSSSMGSTVVIDMEDQVPYEVHRLMSPERIYFDLHDTALSANLEGKSMDVGDPSLARIRIGQPVAGVTRIVLDTKDGSNFSVSMESSPYRLVVELRGNQKTLAGNTFAPNQAHSPAGSTSRDQQQNQGQAQAKMLPVTALAAKPHDQPLPVKTGKFRIVLDAGHGGWDLGTVGRQGLLEKDLVLDVTQRLGKLLQARLGLDVMFTRNDDTYLPLDQRADFANQTQADLFVSIHANYSTSATARGVETYYTNLFSAPGAREAERHDDGSLARLTPVSLSAGSLHEKIEESRRLAASVQRSLYSTLAARSPDIRDRGIKDSAFVVLTGTTMPAVLTEISFVSSPADERNLQSASYRQQIAEALYQGIARYQQSSPRAKMAQLQNPAAR